MGKVTIWLKNERREKMKNLSKVVIVSALILFGAAQVSARSAGVGTAGRAPIPADATCFGSIWNGSITNSNCNRSASTSPYWETDLYMDNAGSKTAYVMVKAANGGKPIGCSLVVVNSDVTYYASSGVQSNTYYGQSQQLTLSGVSLPNYGTAYVTCQVGYQGQLYSINYNP